MRAEHYWQRARTVSAAAHISGALVPLQTQVQPLPGGEPFCLRRLMSWPHRPLQVVGPRPNPFLPWDSPLEVDRLGDSHVLILNKFPVQEAHLLLITQRWQPQNGWLTDTDFRMVAQVAADTGGLWFFNSCGAAGASQPHRHLQLLPRLPREPSCPLAESLQAQVAGSAPAWPWAYALSPRHDALGGEDLAPLYAQHCRQLGLGTCDQDPVPLHPYNLLFDDHWFMTIRRVKEHCAGFSLNGLGFAGYLLSTANSDEAWLHRHGPLALLAAVAAPAP